MKLLLPLAILFAVLSSETVKPEPTRPTEVVSLMKDLKTWLKDTKTEDPRGVFKVVDGVLHISGDGFGYVGPAKEYRDYRVVVEYRWGKRTDGGKYVRNSGIMLHGTGPEGGSGGTWMASIECQLAQGCVGDLITIRGEEKDQVIPVKLKADVEIGPDKKPRWKKGGEPTLFTGRQLWWNKHDPEFKELLDTRGKDDVESPLGEWTKVECTCVGDRISVSVNGTPVNEAYEVFPTAGRILLQSEGFELFVRKFEIHPVK